MTECDIIQTKVIGILGYGEIGTSLAVLYKNFDLRIIDPGKNKNDSFNEIEILNICIPFEETTFVNIISDYVNSYCPQLTIIHSTVLPGTTKKIIEKTKNKNIAYSFVRGIHPYLTKSLLTFIKYIGADDNEIALITKNHFANIGITSKIMTTSKACEMAKLLSTTQYGLNIAFADCMEKMCKTYNLDYHEVVNEPNKTYNEGYSSLGFPQYNRYQLYPPSVFDQKNNPPQIGAHCVCENLELLLKLFPEDPGLNFIKKYSKYR